MLPNSPSMSAITSVSARMGRLAQVGQGPLYERAAAVAALMRSFIGHGQRGMFPAVDPFTVRWHTRAPVTDVSCHGV
jgi:hypothetical protein